jgi:subtilisin family serine protease
MTRSLSRFGLAIVLAAALPLQAQRVHVVVAVGLPELAAQSAASTEAVREQVMESLDAARDGRSHVVPWGRGSVFAADLEPAALERLRHDPRVRAVSIDNGGQGALLESVPLIGADVAHAQGFDGSGITVAVLDTGIDGNNPDFRGRLVAEQCFCDNMDGTGCCPNGSVTQSGPGAASDDNGHGTHVSGILAGGGASAPAGVAPRANIVAVKVMDAENSFKSFTQIYHALEWILQKHGDVRVINMSLGSYSLFSSSDCGVMALHDGLQQVIGALRERGILITASAGNQSSLTGTTLPACMADVLGVGATYDAAGRQTAFCTVAAAQVDDVACFSNTTDAIDLLAPGAVITASKRGGGSIAYAGTSMAAPHVAGAIALMQQASGSMLTADQTELILKVTGKPVVDTRTDTEFPRLNVAAAIAATPRPPVRKHRAAKH